MPLYNYKCTSCNTYERDIYYLLRDLPHVRPCSCGGDMEQDYSAHTVGYSDSGYPYKDPQTGMTYTSATDKQKQLKAAGYEEASWKSGGMSLSEHHKHEAWKQEKTERKHNPTKWLGRDDDESMNINEIDKELTA